MRPEEPAMKTIYNIACCLLAVAIVLSLCGKQYAARAMKIEALAAAGSQENRSVAHEESHAVAYAADRWGSASLMIAGLGLASWIASMVQAKRFMLIPLVLVIVYGALAILMV